jgi:dipeptidyl aminopeptidase/acylaminoacyl peptidase
LLVGLLCLPACGSPSPVGPARDELPAATPGLELQEEDYAAVKSRFRTNLLRKGPAPQKWHPVRPPDGVLEVEYRSGALKLKAWAHRPAGGRGARHPAVLYLHGGWAFDEDDWAQTKPLRDAGFVVMVPILRGENGQPGHFSMFYHEVDDVLAAADHLASLEAVDPKRVYVAGHSVGGTLTMLAAMASNRFRAAASVSGSSDRVRFLEGGYEDVAPFDKGDIGEFRIRSPVAYATSFKCPARLYRGSEESFFDEETRRTALLAKGKGLDVEAIVVPGDHMSCVPEALRQAIEFFRSR